MKHDGHNLDYVANECIVSFAATIDGDGDVVTSGAPRVDFIDGDTFVWCNTCNERVYGGEGGLSENWQVF